MDTKQITYDRQVNLDYLRVFAAFAVMILHIAASNWHTTDVNGIEWQTFNFYDSIVRWAVPVFLMISGALFLQREIPVKKLYSKYIFRMITAFIAWSLFYAVKVFIAGNGIVSTIENFVTGHYHMWFLFMIVGIYMCIPFIRMLVKKEQMMKYFLLLSFIFSFVIPQVMTLVTDFSPEFIIKVANTFHSDISSMGMSFVEGYIFYFVLGYYINSIELNRKQRICIYSIGILGCALTIILDLIVALKTQSPCGNYYGNFTINVFMESLAIFVFFKYLNLNNEKFNKLMFKMSKFSFGAYLVHAFVIELLGYFGINTLMLNPFISVPLIGIFVFLISFLISYICNNIPFINIYFV